MTETTPVIVAIVGAAVGIGGLLIVMMRVLAGTITRESAATNKRIDDLKGDMQGLKTELKADMQGLKTELNNRIDGLERTLNKRIDDVKSDLSTRIDDVKTDLSSRIDETNRQLSALRTEMQQGFEHVHRELGEHRERMAKLEGSLDGFLAGRRDRDAA